MIVLDTSNVNKDTTPVRQFHFAFFSISDVVKLEKIKAWVTSTGLNVPLRLDVLQGAIQTWPYNYATDPATRVTLNVLATSVQTFTGASLIEIEFNFDDFTIQPGNYTVLLYRDAGQITSKASFGMASHPTQTVPFTPILFAPNLRFENITSQATQWVIEGEIIPPKYSYINHPQRSTTGMYLIPSPHQVITPQGNLTFAQIQAQASEITYHTSDNDNIENFTLGGVFYSTFETINIVPTNIKSVRIGDSQTIQIVPKCAKNRAINVKYKNQFGVWEYLLFDSQNTRINLRTSDGQYAEFRNGFWAYDKSQQLEIDLDKGTFPQSSKKLVEGLKLATNAWVALDWQFSDFSVTLQHTAPIDTAIGASDRLVRVMFGSTSAQTAFFERFSIGDRVAFETVAEPFTMGTFVGTIIRKSPQSATVYFEHSHENTGGAQIDGWVTNVTQLRIVAYDSWQLATIENTSTVNLQNGQFSLNLRLRLNPEDGYRI